MAVAPASYNQPLKSEIRAQKFTNKHPFRRTTTETLSARAVPRYSWHEIRN